MFLLLYFYFWILTYFQHLINLIFLYRPLWLCNKLFSILVAQTTTIIYYCSCFLWKGLHWASLGIPHAFAVRCWLGQKAWLEVDDPLSGWFPHHCWQLAMSLGVLRLWISMRLVGCPHETATDFLQSERSWG